MNWITKINEGQQQQHNSCSSNRLQEGSNVFHWYRNNVEGEKNNNLYLMRNFNKSKSKITNRLGYENKITIEKKNHTKK